MENSMIIKTIGELKEAIQAIPDDVPIVRRTNGYSQVLKNDIYFYYGPLMREDHKHLKENEGDNLFLISAD
ncbi:MAG: hypothetical protein ACOCUT_00015 [bacterium]